MRPPPTVDMCPDLDTLAELGAADETVRIAVLGMQGVGKSAITVRYLTHRFIGEYKSNTDMMYHQVIKLDGSTIKVDIIDVSTSVQSGALVHNNIRSWAEGFLLVYAVTEPDSFEHARHLLEELRRTGAGLRTAPVRDGSKSPAGRRKRAATPQRPASGDTGEPTAPTILVGNKTDLIHLTKVDSTLALETALRLGCQREEVSASDSSEEISALFHTVIRQCLALKRRRSGMDALRSAFSSLPRAGRGQGSGLHTPQPGAPARKFSVFDVGRKLGNFISGGSRPPTPAPNKFTTSPLKTSVPDLSKASLSEKLDTLKKTVKKVSV
ncbi:ras-related and estrogen-regulated growth inhibitor-like protein [Pollicipes pollicipes]|uniref:ras-related and estrogen-regulated growth inhibitor-like protein n=1 Tax=Pollicipes pollicipes TaxID=41117 RepID=UPI00188506F4|nr:ras-related and estrogen-regulated growth inhibitor-like protein [Pollicipes pollicipes]